MYIIQWYTFFIFCIIIGMKYSFFVDTCEESKIKQEAVATLSEAKLCNTE